MIWLATRGSALALAQPQMVVAALRSHLPELEFVAVVVDSAGDLSPSTQAPDLPGQGLVHSRLERVLQSGQVDGAVHSAEDLPSKVGLGLTRAGFSCRAPIQGTPWRWRGTCCGPRFL